MLRVRLTRLAKDNCLALPEANNRRFVRFHRNFSMLFGFHGEKIPSLAANVC